jgi:hypothetical protein
MTVGELPARPVLGMGAGTVVPSAPDMRDQQRSAPRRSDTPGAGWQDPTIPATRRAHPYRQATSQREHSPDRAISSGDDADVPVLRHAARPGPEHDRPQRLRPETEPDHGDGIEPSRDQPPALGPSEPQEEAAGQTAGQPSSRRSMPRGWPAKQTSAVWAWMAQPRPPLRVLVGGAEGGVGTSTVTALLGEMIAASSPGPTVIADQCGMPWNALVRRLVGEQAGMPAAQVADMLGYGATTEQIREVAPTTSAGAALIDDGRGYHPLRDLTRVAHTPCGTLMVDAGRVDAVFTARLDVRPVVVVVGRADVIGAEAVCAAVELLHQTAPEVQPVVVLSSVATTQATPSSLLSAAAMRRRVQAAATLVTAAGITHLVHLPHDPRLASGQPLRLNQVGKSTALAGLRLLSRVGTVMGEAHRAHRDAQPGRPATTAGQPFSD